VTKDRPEPVRTFLHVGCGKKRKDRTVEAFAGSDWDEVTLDIDERVRPDIVDSLPALGNTPAGCFDAVYSAHILEHLYPHQVQLALRSFWRVLREDGFAIATCPDLQSVGERLAAGEVDTPLYASPAGPVTALDVLYGFRRSIAQGNLYMAHHGGFTVKSLVAAFRDAGFPAGIGFRRPEHYDLWVIASKKKLGKTELFDLRRRFLVPADQRH
jgi:SAM-dependent methyltransferase